MAQAVLSASNRIQGYYLGLSSTWCGQFRELQSIVSEANRIMEEGGEGKPGEPKISKRQREHHARVMAMASTILKSCQSVGYINGCMELSIPGRGGR